MIELGTKASALFFSFYPFKASYFAYFYKAAFLFLNWINYSGTFSSYLGFLLLDAMSFSSWLFSSSSFFVLSLIWLFLDFIF